MTTFGDRRVMNCSRDDLRRWASDLLGRPAGEFRDDRLDLLAAGVPIALLVRDAPARSFGLVRFHALEVRFDYAPEHAPEAQAWIARFDRHTQRGGG
jgi:hypothetical protein